MNTFVVVKNGVYRHEIIGVFPNSANALEVAITAIKLESDSYHDFNVLGYCMGDIVDDGEFLYRVIRTDTRDDNFKITGYTISVRGQDGKDMELP